jgi:hypothetical protein
MNIHQLIINNDNHFSNSIDQINKLNTLKLSGLKPKQIDMPTTKIVDKEFFDENCEQVVDLKIFKSFINKAYLLIITNESIYTKKLLDKQHYVKGTSFLRQNTPPIKIFSILSFLKNKFGIKSFNILDVKVIKGSIFIKVVNNDAMSSLNNQEKIPFYYILKLCLEKKIHRKNSVFALESAVTNIETLKIINVSYLPLFQMQILEFWINENEIDMIYFSIHNKLYKGELILTESNQNSISDLGICHLVYRNNYGIRFLQFSKTNNLVVFSDKPDRVVILNSLTWHKLSDFQLKLGQIITMKWNENLNLIFV